MQTVSNFEWLPPSDDVKSSDGGNRSKIIQRTFSSFSNGSLPFGKIQSVMQNAQAIYLQTIEALIEENELEKALDAMLEFDKQTSAGLRSDIIAQSGRFKDLEKNFQRGILPFNDYSTLKNGVRFALTGLLADFPKQIELNDQLKGLGGYNFKLPDDVRLEKIIGKKNNLLKINWLEKALRASRAVCRVVCADGELGTGFLTREGYIFTNNHVLPDAAAARDARIEFNYETDLSGNVKSRTTYQLDATDFISSPPDQFDFAKVKVVDNPKQPLSQWGFVDFDTSAVPTVGESVTIIQHPKGEDKQIALNANEVFSTWNQHVFYETDTEPGSSGSPVFNSDWKVVAIHHAGKRDDEGGMQINARGDRRGANRGILFGQIFDFIEKNGGKVPKTGGSTSGNESFRAEPKPSETTNPQPEPTPVSTPVSNPEPISKPTPPPVVAPPAGIPRWVILYDVEDAAAATILNKQLSVLRFTKKITVFDVQKDVPDGVDIESKLDEEIAGARKIIVLATANLFNTEILIAKTLEALEAKRIVVPILVEKFDLSGTGLEKVKSLPSLGRFISDFANRDSGWADVVEQLKKSI